MVIINGSQLLDRGSIPRWRTFLFLLYLLEYTRVHHGTQCTRVRTLLDFFTLPTRIPGTYTCTRVHSVLPVPVVLQ